MFRTITLAVIVSMFFFTGCSEDGLKSDFPMVEKEGKNVQISFNGSASTRAIDRPIDELGNSATTFENGQLVFAKDNGAITKVYTIGVIHDLGDNLVSIGELCTSSGVKFEHVFADKIFVLGNKVIDELELGRNINDVLAEEKNKLQLGDLNGGVYSDQILFGSAPILKKSSIGGSDAKEGYYANVVISPVTARVEVHEIRETNSDDLYTYTLEGIYVNNYYQTLELRPKFLTDGNVSASQQLWMDPDDLVSQYKGESSALHNVLHSPEANNHQASESGDKVWAFSVFPASNNLPTDDYLPHIILHIKDLKRNGVLEKKNYYLTGSRYGAINKFEAGHAYIIRIFDWDALIDGDDTIESNLIEVSMDVSVMDWIPKSVVIDVN